MYKYLVPFAAFLLDITPARIFNISAFSISWLLCTFIVRDLHKNNINLTVYIAMFFIEDIVNLRPFGTSSLALLLAYLGKYLIFVRDSTFKISAQPRFEKYANKSRNASTMIFLEYLTFIILFMIFQVGIPFVVTPTPPSILNAFIATFANIAVAAILIELNLKKA